MPMLNDLEGGDDADRPLLGEDKIKNLQAKSSTKGRARKDRRRDSDKSKGDREPSVKNTAGGPTTAEG